MSSNKAPNIIKYSVLTSTAALLLIAVNTILISQKSSRNADYIKMEIKNISNNLDFLKMEIKDITIDLVPLKRQSQRWNKCFKNTVLWINEKEKNQKGWDISAKESVPVAICNGAVYEPTPNIK